MDCASAMSIMSARWNEKGKEPFDRLFFLGKCLRLKQLLAQDAMVFPLGADTAGQVAGSLVKTVECFAVGGAVKPQGIHAVLAGELFHALQDGAPRTRCVRHGDQIVEIICPAGRMLRPALVLREQNDSAQDWAVRSMQRVELA